MPNLQTLVEGPHDRAGHAQLGVVRMGRNDQNIKHGDISGLRKND